MRCSSKLWTVLLYGTVGDGSRPWPPRSPLPSELNGDTAGLHPSPPDKKYTTITALPSRAFKNAADKTYGCISTLKQRPGRPEEQAVVGMEWIRFLAAFGVLLLPFPVPVTDFVIFVFIIVKWSLLFFSLNVLRKKNATGQSTPRGTK